MVIAAAWQKLSLQVLTGLLPFVSISQNAVAALYKPSQRPPMGRGSAILLLQLWRMLVLIVLWLRWLMRMARGVGGQPFMPASSKVLQAGHARSLVLCRRVRIIFCNWIPALFLHLVLRVLYLRRV